MDESATPAGRGLSGGGKSLREQIGDRRMRFTDDQRRRLAAKAMSPYFFSVPGNHDLVRPAPKTSVVVALRAWHDQSVVRQAFWNDATSEYRIAINASFEQYVIWMKSLSNAGIPLCDSRGGIIPGDFSAALSVSGLKIGLIGLNSAFLQLADGDYKGRLVM